MSPEKMIRNGHRLVLVWICMCISQSGANIFDWVPAPTACAKKNDASSTSEVKSQADAVQAMPGHLLLTLIKPEWPEGYSMKIQANMKQGEWSYEAEEHFDNGTKMASVSVTDSGSTHQTIFNSDPLERYVITNKDTCIAEPGDRDFHPLVFATMTQTSVDPSKISFRHLLEFGSQNDGGFLYMMPTTVRGIKVNHWTSCQEWTDTSSKLQIDVYISQRHKSPWGQNELPVRMEVTGTTGILNSAHIPKNFQFENVYDFVSFQAGPSYKPDESVFYIPTNVVCVGRSDNKAMPDLPDSFEMDVELIAQHSGSSVPLVTSLRYDWDNLVLESVREFAVPMGRYGDRDRHKPKSHFEDIEKNDQAQTDWITVKTLSTVEDYHTGIQYITEKNNNSCIVRHLPESISMSHGSTILRMYKDHKQGLSQLTYQGRSTLRGVPVESWGMDKDGMVQKVFFLTRTKGTTSINVNMRNMTEEERSTFQKGVSRLQFTYMNKHPVIVGMIMRNRTSVNNKNFPMLIQDLMEERVFTWHGDEFKIVKHEDHKKLVAENLVYKHFSWTRMQEMQIEYIGELEVYVQHFQPLHIDGDFFRVSQCYKSEEITKVILTVKTSFTENVLHNPTVFLNSLRSSLARAIGVSIIQISDIQATPLVNRKKRIDVTLVTFNLLGATPMEESKNEQQDLETSKKRLISAVHNGITFDVRYVHESKSFALDKELFAIDYSLEDFPIVEEAGGSKFVQDKNNASDDDDDESGYSGGDVAGVAIAVATTTCVVTLVVVLVILKNRRRLSTTFIPYTPSKE